MTLIVLAPNSYLRTNMRSWGHNSSSPVTVAEDCHMWNFQTVTSQVYDVLWPWWCYSYVAFENKSKGGCLSHMQSLALALTKFWLLMANRVQLVIQSTRCKVGINSWTLKMHPSYFTSVVQFIFTTENSSSRNAKNHLKITYWKRTNVWGQYWQKSFPLCIASLQWSLVWSTKVSSAWKSRIRGILFVEMESDIANPR